MFDHRLAKLAQQEVFKKDGELIGPWDMPTALRPGTLVAVEATLIVYSFCHPEDPATVRLSLLAWADADIILGLSNPRPQSSNPGRLPSFC